MYLNINLLLFGRLDDSRLGRLIRKITVDWDPQYIAHLVSILFTTHPLCNQDDELCKEYKEVFLKVLSKRWKFCRLSQFFICLGNKGAINHKLKMHLLQRSAKFEDTPKKTSFNISNNITTIPQKKTPIVMSTPQQFPYQNYQPYQPFQYQSQLPSQTQSQFQPQSQLPSPPQFQFQVRSHSQSSDNCYKQVQQNQNTNQSPQIFQTVMILSPQTIVNNQGSPTTISSQSPQGTYYQIQDIPKSQYSQSPLNDTASLASSSNSSNSPSPPSIITSTNIPMVTIRSMNQIMTMNTQSSVPVVMTPPLRTSNVQTVSMVMTPPLMTSSFSSTVSSATTISNNSKSNNNSPSMLVTKITTIPNTMTTSFSNENIICLPPGTSMIQTMSPQGTPIQTPNIITITTPSTPNSLNNNNNNDKNPQLSSSSSYLNSTNPNVVSSITSTSHQSFQSKLKGKETTNQEEETPYYSTSSNKLSQSLLFMNPSTASSYSTSSNFVSQATVITSNRNSTPEICSVNPTSNINVSVPIPLSINVRNINKRIADLSLKAEKDHENLSMKHAKEHYQQYPQEEEEEEVSSSSSTYQNIDSLRSEKEKEEFSDTYHITESLVSDESTSFELTKDDDNTAYCEEEIFNLDDFNHEEKKAIYDIIDSSKEDLEEIQMEKDEKIRSFIQENKKEFSNLSTTPKTPPPSLASSPFFQK